MTEGEIIANLLRKHDIAVRIGDWNLAREIDTDLERHGVTIRQDGDGAPRYERAVNPVPPVKRGPGRPRKNPL